MILLANVPEIYCFFDNIDIKLNVVSDNVFSINVRNIICICTCRAGSVVCCKYLLVFKLKVMTVGRHPNSMLSVSDRIFNALGETCKLSVCYRYNIQSTEQVAVVSSQFYFQNILPVSSQMQPW